MAKDTVLQLFLSMDLGAAADGLRETELLPGSHSKQEKFWMSFILAVPVLLAIDWKSSTQRDSSRGWNSLRKKLSTGKIAT